MVKEVGNSNFFTSDFINQNSRDCKLLIEFSKLSFSYSILQISTNQILYTAVSDVQLNWFQADENQFKEFFKTQEVFNFTFSEVIILSNLGHDTLVPNLFFKEELVSTYLNTNEELPNTAVSSKSEFLENIDYHYLYSFPENLENYLKKNLLNVSFVSSQAVLLDFIFKKNVSSQYVNAHIGFSDIHFCYFENKKLKFSNSFSFQNNEDLLYNILNIYRQLGLSPEKIVLNLSGIISKNSELYDLLYKYIKYINFQNRPLKLNYSDRLKEMPGHYFMHHYAALL